MTLTIRTKLDDLLALGGVAKRLRITAESPIDLWLEGDAQAATVAVIAGPLPSSAIIPDVESGDVIAVSEEIDSKGRWASVRLSDLAFIDVFSHLTEDLVAEATEQTTPEQSIARLLTRLASWNRLFQSIRSGLSVSSQKGLFGELKLLQRLFAEMDPSLAVQAWTGPNGGTRDFEWGHSAIEVKTTSARAPYVVRISSERQLDPTAANPLLLWATVIQSAPNGANLSDAVDDLRSAISHDPVATYEFERRLSRVGFVDAQRHRYTERFEIVDCLAYRITDQFPRIDERALPEGIGSIRYDLALSACARWRVELEEAINAFYS